MIVSRSHLHLKELFLAGVRAKKSLVSLYVLWAAWWESRCCGAASLPGLAAPGLQTPGIASVSSRGPGEAEHLSRSPQPLLEGGGWGGDLPARCWEKGPLPFLGTAYGSVAPVGQTAFPTDT